VVAEVGLDGAIPPLNVRPSADWFSGGDVDEGDATANDFPSWSASVVTREEDDTLLVAGFDDIAQP